MDDRPVDWEGIEDTLSDTLTDREFMMLAEHLERMLKRHADVRFISEALRNWEEQAQPVSHRPISPPLTLRLLLRASLTRIWLCILSGMLLYAFGLTQLIGSALWQSNIAVLSCVPLACGLLLSLNYMRLGMWELAKSCRIPLPKVVAARVLVLLLVNVLVNTIATLIFWRGTGAAYVARVTLNWCLPLFAIGALCVFLSVALRPWAAWIALCVLPLVPLCLYGIEQVRDFFASVALGWLGAVALLMFVLFALSLVFVRDRIYRGCMIHEVTA